MYPSKKARVLPIDGPGNNGLRGMKSYSNPRTAIGSWMSTWEALTNYERGFTTSSYETETEHAQYTGLQKCPAPYGAGMVDEKMMISSSSLPPISSSRTMMSKNRNVIHDMAVPRVITHDAWTTNTQVMARHEWKAQVEEKVTSGSNDPLHPYRDVYHDNNIHMRHNRFLTESSRASSSSMKDTDFIAYPVILLHGTCKVVDNLRNKLIDKYGILAMSAVRALCCAKGAMLVSSSTLRSYIIELGVSLSSADFHQMVAYFTPDDTINIDHFIMALKGRVRDFDEMLPRAHYHKYFNNHSIISSSLRSKLRYNASIPDVADGLISYIKAYADEEDRLASADIIELYKDLYASDPIRYRAIVSKLWD